MTCLCLSWLFRYRLQTVRSLAGVSLMLRLLWACLRWDDMAVKPSAAVGTTRKGEKYHTINYYFRYPLVFFLLFWKAPGDRLHLTSNRQLW